MSGRTDTRPEHATLARRSSRRPGGGAAVRPQTSSFHFLSTFVRKPLRTGAVCPSSPALARMVVGSCQFEPGDTVVELGPGTGAFTELILERLNGHGRFVAVEIDPVHASLLRRRFPRCEVVEDSAENLPCYLKGQRAHCIVSGLAWGNMLPRTQNRILHAILRSLAPGAQFVAFAYLHAALLPTSLRFRLRLRRHFRRVETTSVVWRNVPPAFVYRCWRA